MQVEFYDAYKKASNQLKLLARSEIRIKLLFSLEEGPKNLGHLRNLLNLSSSTIIHTMKDMEAEDLVERNIEGIYALTNVGKIQTIQLIEIVKAMCVFSKDKEFWLDHDISVIPVPLLKRIGDLIDFVFVGENTPNVLKAHLNFLQLLMKAKEVKGVSPIFYPDYTDVIKKLVIGETDVQIVVTDEVLDAMLSGGYHQLSKALLDKQNFSLWMTEEDIKGAFTVTDSAFSFGLFKSDNSYDLTKDIISHSDEALTWGRKLFEYYRKRAREIRSEDV